MATTVQERRRTPRHNYHCIIYYPQIKEKEYIRDMSQNGLSFITNHETLPTPIDITLSLHDHLLPITLKCKIIRTDRHFDSYIVGVEFIETPPQIREVLGGLEHFNRLQRPVFEIKHEPRFCHLWGADLSVGCESECVYCHFSGIEKNKTRRQHGKITFPLPVDLTSLYLMKNFPNVIFLSPYSDAFAPKVRDLTYELLSYALPKNIKFLVVTKHLIPDATLRLIEPFKHQFEGIAVGITNIDDRRNQVLEPGCPPSKARLAQYKRLINMGINAEIRADPLFPLIDDTDENIESLIGYIKETYRKNINGQRFSATYIFTYGKYLARLKKIPLMKESAKLINDVSSMEGGEAYSAPLAYKKEMYTKFHNMCTNHGITFVTCGCKERRLLNDGFSTVCRNPSYYHAQEC